jgi:hypothetical protein
VKTHENRCSSERDWNPGIPPTKQRWQTFDLWDGNTVTATYRRRCSTIEMEAARSLPVPVTVCKSMGRYIPEGFGLQHHRCQRLISPSELSPI